MAKCQRLVLKKCGDPAVRGVGSTAVCGLCLFSEEQQLRRQYDEIEKQLAALAGKLSGLVHLDEISRKVKGGRDGG